MSYLENPFCTFTPLFEVDYTKKKNIIAISLFKMPGGGYKDYGRYIDGIFGLLHKKNKKFPGFVVRVFADEKVLEDPELEWLSKRCEVVKFSCSDFLRKDGYHQGTFGTFTRFFSGYDFPNNDTNHVIVLDADIKPMEIDTISNAYHKLKDVPDLKFYYFGVTNTLSKSTPNPHLFPHAVAGRLCHFEKLPREILVEMISESRDGKIDMKNYYGEKSESRGEAGFRYGVDEYYLNKKLLPYCQKNNHLFAFYFIYNIAAVPFGLRKEKPKELLDMMKFMMGKHYRKDKNLDFNLSKFDKITYKKYQNNAAQGYIAKRFFYLMKLLRRDQKYNVVTKRQVDIALDIYPGIAAADGIGFSTPTVEPIPLKGIARYELQEKI